MADNINFTITSAQRTATHKLKAQIRDERDQLSPFTDKWGRRRRVTDEELMGELLMVYTAHRDQLEEAARDA